MSWPRVRPLRRWPRTTRGTPKPPPSDLTPADSRERPPTRRTPPPFRADHVGSLLRPSSLLAARDDFAAGQIDAAQLRAAEDAAIADVVTMQDELGLQSVTDGEFRRASWHMDFIYQPGGRSTGPADIAAQVRVAAGVS